MTEISGICLCSAAGAVTGRLCRAPFRGDEKGAKILLLDGDGVPDDFSLECTVGIVLVSDSSPSHSQQKLAQLYRIPTIRIRQNQETRAWGNGEAAVLDTALQRLFVDPDIETISRYFSSTAKSSTPSPRILTLSEDGRECLHDGLLISSRALVGKDEEQAYEYLCELSDRCVGLKLAVEVRLENEQTFEAHVRAVYRAGVWGRFCLLCSNVLTAQRARRCVELLHKCFFELDALGREFNGYISKGVVVDTPLLLLGQPIHGMIDLFCVDYFALARRFSGRDEESTEVNGYVHRFSKERGGARVALLCERALSPNTLSYLTRDGAIEELYLPETAAKAIRTQM